MGLCIDKICKASKNEEKALAWWREVEKARTPEDYTALRDKSANPNVDGMIFEQIYN